MAGEILRNDSTEGGKKIWEAVERAAEKAPDWVKRHLDNAGQSREVKPAEKDSTAESQ